VPSNQYYDGLSSHYHMFQQVFFYAFFFLHLASHLPHVCVNMFTHVQYVSIYTHSAVCRCVCVGVWGYTHMYTHNMYSICVCVYTHMCVSLSLSLSLSAWV
jgi:hypothetical protein